MSRLLVLGLLIWPFVFSLGAPAQTGTASVIMLSDIHFDPFRDTAKVSALRGEPIERWPAILNSPPSATQAQDLTKLQADCNSRALDAGWKLLQSSLMAAREAESHPAFITLSGDLLTHEFPCRFEHTAPGASPQDLAAFAAKTVAFVLQQTREAFPRIPVFGSLGNNDSGCGDYRETAGDSFATTTASALAAATGRPVEGSTPEGDYSVPLPAPFVHGRLIVLENIFETRQFNTCAGTADHAPEKAQIDWLRQQLEGARSRHEQVWIMSHVPPGVDIYTSFRHYVLQPGQLCTAEPRAFLANPALADTLLDFPDVIRLAVFGHTHMDDIRVLASPDADRNGTPAAVPAKLVPSVSPVLGNHPSFLVASVDPRTAVLKDWRTIVSPMPEGSIPPWTEAYRYSTTYHLPDFSARSALKLANGLVADPSSHAPASSAFREHFFPGDLGLYALGLSQIWPAYACSIRNSRPSEVHTCICMAAARPTGTTKPNP